MRLLQTQDVAGRLGVATSTVRRWAAQGLLPFQWAGTYRVFDPAEVRRLARKLGEWAGTRAGRQSPRSVGDPGVTDPSQEGRDLEGSV